jgi:hypothetical protein
MAIPVSINNMLKISSGICYYFDVRKSYVLSKVGEKETHNTSDDIGIHSFTGTRHLNVDLKMRPDIRYPACTGYPVSGLYQISGLLRPVPAIRYPACRLAGYSANSVPYLSGASLELNSDV